MRINIGAGSDGEAGWIPWDISFGARAEKITLPDGCVEEIRASHVLEHVRGRDTIPTLKEWHRVLRHGGRLFVAVPDFELIVGAMANGHQDPLMESYIMGGQIDEHDFHYAIFSEAKLTTALQVAGFRDIRRCEKAGESWNCSHHWCSLNMEAFA